MAGSNGGSSGVNRIAKEDWQLGRRSGFDEMSASLVADDPETAGW